MKKYQTGGKSAPKKPVKNTTSKKPSSMDTAWNTAKTVGKVLINPGGEAVKVIKKAYSNSSFKKLMDAETRSQEWKKKNPNWNVQSGAVTRKKGGAIKTKKK
jgi:hypothetical protein